METEKQSPSERETPPLQWTCCKLIIDPALTKGLYKVYRYDGQRFNLPVRHTHSSLFVSYSHDVDVDGKRDSSGGEGDNIGTTVMMMVVLMLLLVIMI